MDDTKIATAEPEVQDIPDVIEVIQIGDESFNLLETTIKKGRGGPRALNILQPNDGEDFWNFITRFRKVVGSENFDKAIQKYIIRQSCIDATAQALKDSPDGNIAETAWVKAEQDWYVAETRRSGEHVKDLREKLMAMFAELNDLIMQQFKHPKFDDHGKPTNDPEALSDNDHNRMLQLTLEYSELNAKIEGRSRKGKKAAK